MALPLIEAYTATETITPDQAHSHTALILNELINFPYLAVGGSGRQPWLVFFEYRGDKPRIVALGIDE